VAAAALKSDSDHIDDMTLVSSAHMLSKLSQGFAIAFGSQLCFMAQTGILYAT
jgi:hypothetical protein